MKNALKRVLALLLCLLLVPFAPVRADEAGTILNVTCSDVFWEDTETVVPILEASTGYYITLENACRMIGLTYAGGDWLTPNGLLFLRPETGGMECVEHDGEVWLRLEEIMNELDTAVIPTQTGLQYVSVPINQDRLTAEVNRILANGGYEADMLSDSFIGQFAAAFAFLFDVVWNTRFDMINGEAYEDDIATLLVEILQPIQSETSLEDLLAKTTKQGEKVAKALLDAQKCYEFVGDAAGFAVPNGEYLLYGLEGTGTFHETLRAVDALDDMGIQISDFISVTAHVTKIGRAESMYADALERVLTAPEAMNPAYTTVAQQGRNTVRIYQEHLEDSRGALVAEGVLMLAEDILTNLAKDSAKDLLINMHPGVGLAKLILEVADSCTLETMKKNDCVRTLTMCAQIQALFDTICTSCVTDAVDRDGSLMMRDAAILYLKTAWTAYDSANFDEEIAGAIRMVQKKIGEELTLLALYPDSMFCMPENEALPVGILSVNLPQDVPEVDADVYRDLYMAFLEAGAYIPSVTDDWLRTELEAGYGGGNYYFHDVNRDGYEDLLIWLGCAGDTGETLLFTAVTGTVELCGTVLCGGDAIGIYGSDIRSGFILAEFDGETEWRTACDLVGDEIVFYAGDPELAEDWYPMEPDGWLPLNGGNPEDTPAPDDIGIRETALSGRFSMTMPDRWKDQYVIVDSVMAFTVYEKQNYEAGYGGELFTVYMSGYTDESQVGEFEEVLLNQDGWIIVVTFPLTVQWADGDEGLSMAYFMLQPDIREVLDSVRLEG